MTKDVRYALRLLARSPVSASAPGLPGRSARSGFFARCSAIVFDHLSRAAVDASLAPESRRPLLDRLRAEGEPQIFGLAAGAERAFVSGAGLTLARHVFSVSAETLKYLKRRDGTLIGDPQWPLAAGRDLPRDLLNRLAADGMGWLALAEVPISDSRGRTGRR